MRYLPHTPEEVAEMLATIGKGSIDELFETVPEKARFNGQLDVPAALDEPTLMTHLAELADKNDAKRMLSFLGGGMYAHHIPPAVDQLLLRSEFYTAYTPYQPEVAQGTLQAIWEFQTVVSELLGLPLSNASLYDGASATAEAALMACRLQKRDKVVLSECVHPDYRAVTHTYLSGEGQDRIVKVPVGKDGRADTQALIAALSDDVAAVIVGYPSFLGPVSDLSALADAVHEKGALLVTATAEPYALAVCQPPGAMGADIAVGEGQPLACPPQFGGPGVGLFACRDERRYLQQLPGRVCGETVDVNGQRGYVLTLSTREQHIRRERATSNICTNQGLLALALLIRTSLLGKSGFVSVAEQCLAKARYLEDKILTLGGYSRGFDSAPYFNELSVRVRGGSAAAVCQKLEADGIIAGLDLGRVSDAWKDLLLVAVTEQHRREDLDRLVAALDRV
ncbi:MAG: aminomethyl-transferring glycine dehydrogenase subunit GcvPA [Myxococcales bacterium]|nr:aminomethyl-transferring glycine dehydrogenase subunit GcvPA [Myxococcales bacterium]MCB9577823.1 aminomethyl-transferring glycine dehydrogenase subunit GcvPA [Polyangiaceae bacterium]